MRELPIRIWSPETKGAYDVSHRNFEPASEESPLESNENNFKLSAEVWQRGWVSDSEIW